MKRMLYVVYDVVAQEVSGGVNLFAHDAVAVRFFTDLLGNQETWPAKHPADYSLLLIGALDLSTGVVEPLGQPVSVLTGDAWLAMQSRGPSLEGAVNA